MDNVIKLEGQALTDYIKERFPDHVEETEKDSVDMDNKEILEAIAETTFLNDCVDSTWLESQDDQIDYATLEQYVHEYEVIYYHVAMEFLSEHDPSMYQSMEIAQDLGYEPKDINSELLATLLFQHLAMQELYEIGVE